MNQTIEKFGYPATLVKDDEHWLVLLRPQQPTLGSLVLTAKSEATAFSDLNPAAFAELATVVSDIEAALAAAVRYERINYMMLMMVDPNVHFHVIPRYSGERTWNGLMLEDKGWPKMPDLSSGVALDEAQITGMAEWLRSCWPA